MIVFRVIMGLFLIGLGSNLALHSIGVDFPLAVYLIKIGFSCIPLLIIYAGICIMIGSKEAK